MPSCLSAPLLHPYLRVELAGPAFIPAGPSSSFFLDPPKLRRNYNAEVPGMFVLYPVLLASAP